MGAIAFVYKNKCHPVSQTYADAIDAVPYKMTGPLDGIWKGLTLPTYKGYFIESVMSMLVPVTKRLLGKKVIIIFRGNDGLFGEKTEAYLWTKNPIKKWFLLFLIKNMNGIIVESEMTKRDAEQWTNVPIEICESYVENKELLEKIKPNLKTNKFLFIGEYRPPYDHKNIAFLLKIFANLPEYELIIIGKNTKKLQKKATKNVHILDYIQNKDQWYKKVTYYLHLPKYETGPITLLEAMIAGVIPITNTNAGHHSLIKNIEKKIILDAKKIEGIVKNPIKRKQKISETFKKIGINHFRKEDMVKKFRNKWMRLVQKIKEEKENLF